AAAAGEVRAFLTGEEPLATWAGVYLARHKMFFSSAKAERELGYHARPHQTALTDAIAWFSRFGYLGRSSREPGLGGYHFPLH
ncbi:MAG: hypothetical protein ACREDL_15425, partial [Bradyrhizobium sp.]